MVYCFLISHQHTDHFVILANVTECTFQQPLANIQLKGHPIRYSTAAFTKLEITPFRLKGHGTAFDQSVVPSQAAILFSLITNRM